MRVRCAICDAVRTPMHARLCLNFSVESLSQLLCRSRILISRYLCLSLARSLAEFSFFESLLSCLSTPVAMHCHQAGNQDRDVDLYHWSSAKFESTWRDTISVLVARGRAQVGVHSAKSDWSRRILDFAYMDYDDQAAHHE